MVVSQYHMEIYIFDNCRSIPKSIERPLQFPRKPLSHELYVPGDGRFWKISVAMCHQRSVIGALAENNTQHEMWC